ncbi:hypothetical protein R6Q59_033011 [Mikania micrantha]
MQQGETVVTIKDDEDYSLKSIPYKVKHLVVSYLQKWKHPKAGRLTLEKIQNLKLEWGIEDNITDCGDKAKQKNQIIALRKKYSSRILLSNVNVQKERVLKEAGLKCME